MPPPLAWLDSSPRPGFTQMISETRPVRGGWLTDPGVPSLCSQESWQRPGPWASWEIFPLHTLLQVEDFSEHEISSSWVEVCMIISAGLRPVGAQLGRSSLCPGNRSELASFPALSFIYFFLRRLLLSCCWAIRTTFTLPYFWRRSLKKKKKAKILESLGWMNGALQENWA